MVSQDAKSPLNAFPSDDRVDSSKVDFTNPESFFHDVNSVAGLLKQFFRELPDPLFTHQHYADFISAARKCSSETAVLSN
jgi:hypothetical protein